MEYRTPPQNIEAEEGVIASLLLDKELLSEIIPMLAAEDFYREDLQNIYKTIAETFNSHKPVDIITVADKLGMEHLDYLTNITNRLVTPQNAKHYAGIVKGKSIRRQYIDRAKKVIDLAYSGDYETVTDFKNDIFQLLDVDIKDQSKEKNTIEYVVNSTLNRIEGRYKNTNPSKLLYGFPWLDKMTGGAHGSDLTIIAARPSIGKTAFSSNVAINIASKGNAVAMFNLEMDKESLIERTLANESGVDGQRIRYGKTLTDDDWAKLGMVGAEIGSYKINLYDTVFKLEDIRAECRSLKNKNMLDFVVVDYLQLVDTTKKTTGNTDRVSYLSRQFKLMAKEFKVPIWLLSQLNRSNEHDNRRPKLIDLRDSGSIEQDADNVIFLHDENYGKYTEDMDDQTVPIELIIAKQRNGKRDIYREIGFRKSVQRFVELEVRNDNYAGTAQKSKQRRKMPDDERDN
jgi:replicative DNA helicase